MENERLNIFDEDQNLIGVASRDEVHKNGYWHITFHCWFICREEGIDYIYFQIRSDKKKDYPNLLDITAAGHILAHETIADGIREVKEELGIDLTFNELISLGIMKYCIVKEEMIDKEFAHVFLYVGNKSYYEFRLQEEEVSGIVRAEFNSFYDLWLGERENIRVDGFEIDKAGEKSTLNKLVGKDSFVPHEEEYYETIVKLIRKNIS